jgi:catechol 2,3-dioxygenase-like lactoylglutathione lyase family enzyme
MRPQPLICVTDVEASSRWYQRLLACQSGHGGKEYERLIRDSVLVMQLHNFDIEHHHGPIGDRDRKPYGNGVLLWFDLDDFDAAVARAAEMQVEVVRPAYHHAGAHQYEIWLRDPDGYTLVLSGPDGTRPAGLV